MDQDGAINVARREVADTEHTVGEQRGRGRAGADRVARPNSSDHPAAQAAGIVGVSVHTRRRCAGAARRIQQARRGDHRGETKGWHSGGRGAGWRLQPARPAVGRGGCDDGQTGRGRPNHQPDDRARAQQPAPAQYQDVAGQRLPDDDQLGASVKRAGRYSDKVRHLRNQTRLGPPDNQDNIRLFNAIAATAGTTAAQEGTMESHQAQDHQDARCNPANGYDAAEDRQPDSGGARGGTRTDAQG